ncbi:MAG: MotA/TolQ/ExbB proton channel family protein [Magnetococcales bacterium]|nr:MotA/TolQ/ExbB proton channel family protein [Magnetococcales bacterium]
MIWIDKVLNDLSWWASSDWVVRGVFIVLIVASVISWTIILYKYWQISVISRGENRLERLLFTYECTKGLSKLEKKGRPSGVLIRTLRKWKASGLPKNRHGLEMEIAHSIREQRIYLENGLTFLATIGSGAPFIGLLGTVWGIMHALSALDGVSTLTMDLVAGPVSEALVATAVGLFTAIPAVMGYNMLVRKLRRVMATLEGIGLRLVNLFEKERQEAN